MRVSKGGKPNVASKEQLLPSLPCSSADVPVLSCRVGSVYLQGNLMTAFQFSTHSLLLISINDRQQKMKSLDLWPTHFFRTCNTCSRCCRHPSLITPFFLRWHTSKTLMAWDLLSWGRRNRKNAHFQARLLNLITLDSKRGIKPTKNSS